MLVAVIKKKLKVDHSLYTLLQIFSLNIFEKVPINELLTNKNYNLTQSDTSKQLTLFDL